MKVKEMSFGEGNDKRLKVGDYKFKESLESTLSSCERIIGERIVVMRVEQLRLEDSFQKADGDAPLNQLRYNAVKINEYVGVRCNILNLLSYLKNKTGVYIL